MGGMPCVGCGGVFGCATALTDAQARANRAMWRLHRVGVARMRRGFFIGIFSIRLYLLRVEILRNLGIGISLHFFVGMRGYTLYSETWNPSSLITYSL